MTVDASSSSGAVDAASPTLASVPAAPPWGEIRAAYLGSDLAVAAIARAYGIDARRIHARAAREGWPRRRSRGPAREPAEPLDRQTLVARLFRAVERQIAEIERRFDGPSLPDLDERDARTLGALARTLELLIGLEKQAGRDEAEPEPDIDAFRLDLARRLAGLRRPQ